MGKPPVVVTFDDGYANNFHHALPVLQQFSVPATIFLATSYLGTHRFSGGTGCVFRYWPAALEALGGAARPVKAPATR